MRRLNFFELANLKTKTTSLPMNIFISTKGSSPHGPRIKVQSNYSTRTQETEFFTLTISNEPEVIGDPKDIKIKDIELVKSFILANKRALIRYWNDEIDTAEVLSILKKAEK